MGPLPKSCTFLEQLPMCHTRLEPFPMCRTRLEQPPMCRTRLEQPPMCRTRLEQLPMCCALGPSCQPSCSSHRIWGLETGRGHREINATSLAGTCHAGICNDSLTSYWNGAGICRDSLMPYRDRGFNSLTNMRMASPFVEVEFGRGGVYGVHLAPRIHWPLIMVYTTLWEIGYRVARQSSSPSLCFICAL